MYYTCNCNCVQAYLKTTNIKPILAYRKGDKGKRPHSLYDSPVGRAILRIISLHLNTPFEPGHVYHTLKKLV